MSDRLDDELRRAIAAKPKRAEAPSGADSMPGVVRDAAPKANTRRNIGLLLTLLAMVAALVVLVLKGFGDAAVYSMPVDRLLTANSKYVGRKVRVDGELVPGTLAKRDQPCEYRFTIHGEHQLPVRYAQCVIPDTFRDVPGGGVQVTVEGTLKADNSFEATLVMAKCSSKYDPATHEMKGAPASANDAPKSGTLAEK